MTITQNYMQVFQGKGSTNNRKGTNTDKSWERVLDRYFTHQFSRLKK